MSVAPSAKRGTAHTQNDAARRLANGRARVAHRKRRRCTRQTVAFRWRAGKLALVPFAPMIPFARYLPAARQDLASSLRRRGRGVFLLQRRDAVLGAAVTVHRDMPSEAQVAARWQRADAVFLPRVLGDAPQAHEAAIAATLAMFDRLRDDGADFLDELEERLADDDRFRYAGSTIDQDDPREIERVFVDALDPDAARPVGQTADGEAEDEGEDEESVSIEAEDRSDAIAKDLWAKLAWITAEDPSDRSLRIRFSNGLDQLEEWLATGDHDASMGDLFALRTFPECAAMLTSEGLRTRLDRMIARPHRLSERIIYNNAPNGGAIFHHDAEPGQIGVVFAQLEGRTAWLTLPKRRLAALLNKRGYGGGGKVEAHAIKALDGCSEDDDLQFLLNRDESFAAELAAVGALYILEAGDAIVLPSHGFDDVAWHSVLAVGDTPSLAHSYGIFPRDESYDPAGDPWLDRGRPRLAERVAASGSPR
ncbi:MAG: hypothetical protein AB8H80_19500 [Planctomycetota bacterium]